MRINAVRTGAEGGDTSVSVASAGEIVASSVSVGFEIVTNTVIPPDRFAATIVTRSARGAQWRGQPIEAGDVLIHGPETPHTARNPAGLAFTFATVPVEDVQFASEVMGSLADDLTGSFVKLPQTPATHRLGLVIAGAFDATSGNGLFSPPPLDSVAVAVADAIDTTDDDRGSRATGRIDDAGIVNTCVDLAESTGRVPGIGELRHVAHVSETRLREAFVRQLDMPPSKFFRQWGLDRARRRLVDSVGGSATITMVATDIGFAHLGRFSRYYHSQFGELPSATLSNSLGRSH